MSQNLTKKQKRLINEIEQICQALRLDFGNAGNYGADERTTQLELIKRQIVLGEVVRAYTLVDENLNVAMCHFFFGKQRSFIRLWRTKRFRVFNHHIIEELPLLPKLRLVKALRSVDSRITQDIERLNALRNGLAHAFFPENLRKTKPEWKGKDIFSLDGIQAFTEDIRKIYEYFWEDEKYSDRQTTGNKRLNSAKFSRFVTLAADFCVILSF